MDSRGLVYIKVLKINNGEVEFIYNCFMEVRRFFLFTKAINWFGKHLKRDSCGLVYIMMLKRDCWESERVSLVRHQGNLDVLFFFLAEETSVSLWHNSSKNCFLITS